MPRPTRVYVEGALHLVTCHTAEAGSALFRNDQDYETYLELLGAYSRQFGFRIFAYVLLPEQVSLLMEPVNGTTVSTFMHALNSRYTKRFIKRHGHTSRLFDRFKLTVLEKAPSLLRVTGYLHTLPRLSGVTHDVEGYRWSSTASYLAAGASRPGQCPEGEVAEVLSLLGEERPGWTYALYLQSIPNEEWERMSRELERPAVGSPEFLALVEQQRCQTPAKAGKVSDTIRIEAPGATVAHTGRRSPIMTLSLAMAFVSVVAALLSARNVSFLKSTLRSVAEDSGQVLLALGSRTPALASLHAPDRLEGTAWQVQLKPLAGAQTAASADHLEFTGERMVSANLREVGFLPGHFRAAPSANGLTWETVQIGPGGEIVSWRGESSGRMVHGMVTRQRPGGSVETFRFMGMNAQDTSEI